MKYLIGNWKANKTSEEALHYVETFVAHYHESKDRIIIICPSYHLLPLIKPLEKQSGTFIGSQDVSSRSQGSYTGEIAASNIHGLATYAIIGHSERRKNFGETDELLAIKTKQAIDAGLIPIYCIRDEKDSIPPDVQFVAYEPVAAIGTGQNEAPEKVVEMKRKLQLPKDAIFIYGGSVNASNAYGYLETGEIDGFLVGKASLDPESFLAIIP